MQVNESHCKRALNCRNVLLASTALVVASALGSTTIMNVAHAQAAKGLFNLTMRL
jgi:hypothetical protein